MAIFVDGDFWHGHNWKLRGLKDLNEELSAYKEFWVRKIRNNVKRDRTVNSTLRKDNWRVIRIWESDLKMKPERITQEVLRFINQDSPAR